MPQVSYSAELPDALFQMVVTGGLALFALVLYRRLPERWFAWWAAAWGVYTLRLGAIVMFMETGNRVWLFWHQVATGWVALAILYAAQVFSRDARWRRWYAVLVLFPPLWGWVAIHTLDKVELAAIPMVGLISGVTLWTGWVFWQHARRTRSSGARLVAIAFTLWGLHHLDYTFLRVRGEWHPWGYYLDIVFELAVGIGFGVMVLSELATRLEVRTKELAHLSTRMVRQHEEERRRLQRDLHDETAQTFSAVKMEVGMLREGADDVARDRLDHVLALVDGGLRGIRRVMHDLRPALLDDLGLLPAIRSLADDVRERGALTVDTELPAISPALTVEAELALFRAAQEALANVVRHAEASRVTVHLRIDGPRLRLTVRDNGRGLSTGAGPATSRANHVGLAGMRERIMALGGSVDVQPVVPSGVLVTVELPLEEDV